VFGLFEFSESPPQPGCFGFPSLLADFARRRACAFPCSFVGRTLNRAQFCRCQRAEVKPRLGDALLDGRCVSGLEVLDGDAELVCEPCAALSPMGCARQLRSG